MTDRRKRVKYDTISAKRLTRILLEHLARASPKLKGRNVELTLTTDEHGRPTVHVFYVLP